MSATDGFLEGRRPGRGLMVLAPGLGLVLMAGTALRHGHSTFAS